MSTLNIIGVKTDTMSKYDKVMPAYNSGIRIPQKTSAFYPAYKKPNRYFYVQVNHTGIHDFKNDYRREPISDDGNIATFRFDIAQDSYYFPGPYSSERGNCYQFLGFNVEGWNSDFTKYMHDNIAPAFILAE